MVFELLLTAPLSKSDFSIALIDVLIERLDRIDAGLLQAWSLRHMIQQPTHRISPRAHRHHTMHSLFVAELAVNLAREMGYPHPDEARSAGLLHDIGLLWLNEYGEQYGRVLADAIDERSLSAAEWERYGLDHAEISADLAARCGFPLGIVDAIALHQAEPEAVDTAHPLVRVIAAAEELASYRGSQSAASLEGAGRLTKIDGSVLVSLLADTTRGMQDMVKVLDIVVEPTMLTLPWATPGTESERENTDSGIARTALTAFARSAFIDAGTARQSFDVATRLLLGLDAPVLFVKSECDDALVGAPTITHPGLDQIRISARDENSAVADAFRNNAESRYQSGPRPPGPVRRRLAAGPLARQRRPALRALAEPQGIRRRGVPVRGCRAAGHGPRAHPAPHRHRSRHQPHLRAPRRRADAPGSRGQHRPPLRGSRPAHRPRGEQPAHRHQDLPGPDRRARRRPDPERAAWPAQRRTRPRRRPGAQGQRLHLDDPPPAPAHSGVAEILHDLRALYGEALFARKGINFELRTSPNLPAAAIPPDALKQVFLNLFKNAAEAIPEGGKLTVSAVAGINANGSQCMEIRIVDNGPGLAPERIETLFNPGARNSDKPGGGVGLPLVRELVAAVGGTILCRSQPGSGTVFQIFMPLAANH